MVGDRCHRGQRRKGRGTERRLEEKVKRNLWMTEK